MTNLTFISTSKVDFGIPNVDERARSDRHRFSVTETITRSTFLSLATVDVGPCLGLFNVDPVDLNLATHDWMKLMTVNDY